jgi:hypothetical protein
MAPTRLELGLTSRTATGRLALAAVRAEFGASSRWELPTTHPTGLARTAPAHRPDWRGWGFLLGWGGVALVRWSKGKLGLGVERLGHRFGVEMHHGVLVPLNDGEIRVGTCQLLHEFIVDLVRAGSGEPAFSGAEPQERQFVVFAAFQLEGSAIGAVRQYGIANVHQKQWLCQAGGIACSDITNELNEKSLQIGHQDLSPFGKRDLLSRRHPPLQPLELRVRIVARV